MMWKRIVWVLALASASWAQTGMEGTWQGSLARGKLRIGLQISKNETGEWTSMFYSIDQGSAGMPVKLTTVSGQTLHFEMPARGIKYDGTLSADGQEIAGMLNQGAALPLIFKRVAKLDTLNRPQTPKGPFPYDAMEVSYENNQGKLAGTLTVPHGSGPFPAAIMISGSGPENRDEEVFGHQPFWVIADYLSRRGIAILRLDDRGVGGSGGSSQHQTMDQMAADVISGVDFLKARKEIDGKQIGVIGHSEGGTVGPLAASRSSDIAFVVMLAGTGVTGDQLMYLQSELIDKASGVPAQTTAQNRALQEMIFNIVRAEPDETKAIANFRVEWLKTHGSAPSAAAESQVKGVLLPEIRSFAFLDPAEALRKLKIPVLAMNGARDLQVPPVQNLPAIAAALAAGGNTDFQIVELPGMNHLFQSCRKGTPDEYGTIDETFSPIALGVMGEWLARHVH